MRAPAIPDRCSGRSRAAVSIHTGSVSRPAHASSQSRPQSSSAAVRQQTRRADERAAEELAVRLVMPLGLCLLPAFVCWGVVPVVMALLGAGPG